MIPALLILSAAVLIVLVARVGRGRAPGGRPRRSLSILVMVVLPILWLAAAAVYADNATRGTSFCLRCHEMQRYGASVTADNASIPATHFRNGWVEQERACYICHTIPGLSGAVEAKARGVRDVYVHYLGDVPDVIELDAPYDGEICLACHGEEGGFLAVEAHRPFAARLPGSPVSCFGCHAISHDFGG
jgi:cytochrome c-type protein NapC